MYVVTGASSGIGFATAMALAARNCEVIAVARNHERMAALKERFPQKVKVVAADLASTTGIDLVHQATHSVKQIDGIVHAAGSLILLKPYEKFVVSDSDALSHHLAVHVAAPITLNNVLRRKVKGARILYLDSFSANNLRKGWAEYSIIKAAAQMAARSAQAELKDSIVVRLFPGGVRTPLVEAVLESESQNETVELFRKMKLEGSLFEPEEVANYIGSLLLDATDEQLNMREYWDFSNSDDRIF